jgi:CRISPR/Cas system-associated exonuclease Cas4 (RecB family)
MLATLLGSVIHGVLEVILRVLQSRGCPSVADPRAVEALREMGGFSRIIEDTIAAEVASFESNPRAADRMSVIQEQLRRAIPEIRQRVQGTLSRIRLQPGGDRSSSEAAQPAAGRIGRGTHTEVELRVEALRVMGRADLLTIEDDGCVITDYKTGVPDDRHADQVRFYALLWERDAERNPDRLPVKNLVVAYAAHDVTLVAPTNAELEALAADIAARISDVEERLRLRPSPAYPAPSVCRYCSVRQLCDDYWTGSRAITDTTESVTPFVDCEATVTRRNGPRSWILSLGADSQPVLLRTPTDTPGFFSGDAIRLLGVALGRDEDTSSVVLTMTQYSEVFALDSPATPGVIAMSA